ncbi:MAG TPA: hypothetical protein VHC43_15610 [Mycobacteriales bacterium]|nr:hypothetical protein [Mycobacteriales bacterium]
MRHRDDDISRFREDPVVKALTAPASDAELADEAQARAAFSAAVPQRPRRRSAARIATTSVAAVVTLGVSGGVAAAYTASLPDSWQAKLHKDLSSLHIPAPKAKPTPRIASPSPPPVSVIAPPTAVQTSPSHAPTVPPRPHSSPTSAPTSPPPTPQISPTLPVTVQTTPPATTPPPPPPTSPPTSPPATAVQLTITVSPGNRVPVGSQVTVEGSLTAADGSPVANHRVVLTERPAGEHWQRVGTPVRTSASGEAAFTIPSLERNARLTLRAGRHVHSTPVRVVVIPVIALTVAPTAPGATSTTVSLQVRGAQPGDVVLVRHRGGSQQATLDGALRASFTVPVSQTQVIHYRAVVSRTKAHAAHALAFYVPASGG